MSEVYVDGFLLPIAREQVEGYREIAEQAAAVWKEHGALEYRECVADDLEHEEMASFLDAAGAEEGETVVLAWITFESREARDAVNAAVMADPRLGEMMPEGTPAPFDPRRMAYGGFRTLVER